MRLTLIFCLFFIALCAAHGQKPKIHSTTLSVERLISELNAGAFPPDPMFNSQPDNTAKRTFSISAQTKVDLYKNKVHLLVDLGYDERKALETFSFFKTGLTGNTGIGSIWTLGGVPTSTQSLNFEEFNAINNIFPELPNFKYLNLAAIPSYEFRYKRLGINVGVGIFYNILLNKEDLVFGREWFPWTDFIFEEPFLVSGEIRYNKVDFGFIKQVGFSYRVSDHFRLIANAKFLKSRAILNTEVDRAGSRKWRVRKYGIGIEYIFHFDEKEQYRFFNTKN